MVTTTTEVNAVYTPLKSNSSSKSISKILLLLLVVLFLAATIVLAFLFIQEKNKNICDKTKLNVSSNDNDVCITPYCIKTAGTLLQNMDENVDPCENFYEFTCGSWMKNTKLSDTDEIESSTSKLRERMYEAIIGLLSSPLSNEMSTSKAVVNAHRLYETCVNEDEIDDRDIGLFFVSIRDDFKDWLLQSNSTAADFNSYLTKALVKFNQYNSFFFYQVKTILDYDNIETLKYRIRITPGHMRHKDDDEMLYIGEDRFVKYFEDSDEFDTLSTTTPSQTLRLGDFKSDIDDHLKWTNAPMYIDDITTTVKNLTKTINSNFDFSDYIRRLYRLAGINLADDDVVVIGRINDIRSIAKILSQYSSKTIFTYMMARFLSTHSFHMPKNLRTLVQSSLFSDSSTKETRELECAKFVNKHMGYAVSKLYISKYFDNVARQESIEIVENVRETFIEMIEKSTWMDEISKKRTAEKAEAILGKIGYPAFLDDDKPIKLDEMYKEYRFTSSHIKNTLLLFEIHVKKNLGKLRQSFDHDDWSIFTPTTINAFYLPILNDIIFPAAFLQPPFFHKDAPKYMNYGGIGTTIGHEITHGFDEMRRHLDKDRKNYTLWSNETTNIYNKRSKCLVDQYSTYRIAALNQTINGSETLDENISDNDGLKKAFYAYEKWRKKQKIIEKKLPGLTKYSRQQMFFINFGQIWCSKMGIDYARLHLEIADHAPHSFRLIGSTSNFIEFDRAFNCKPGQRNSRENKCSVW